MCPVKETTVPEKTRADAGRNRQRILAVARDALAESTGATMQSIAKAAGIGQGTLYRHFPTREDLLLVVYRADFDELVAAAPALLAAYPPVEALRRWLDRLASFGKLKHGLADVFRTATKTALHGEQYGPVLAAITLLLDAAKAAGELRPDVDAQDLLQLVGFLWHTDVAADHLLDVVMDGLRRRV